MIGQRPSREAIMTALFNVLVGSLEASFTANTIQNSAVLVNPSSTAGFFLGLPVFGLGIPRGAVIADLSPLTLSIPANATATAVSMSTGFLTVGRRVQWPRQNTPQPALYLRGADEDLTYQSIVLQQQTINAEIWVFAKAGENPDVVPEILLNNLLDAVQASFAPDNAQTRQFTLGGLVSWCRMSGRIEKDTGDQDPAGQAAAVIDVEIIVP
jgi:hypothetical protein